MIEACFKAFARALRAAVAIDPTETGVPCTKGTLTRERARPIAVVDYGMGNRRSVEKALERVGARAAAHARPRRAARRRRRSSCPASGAFPQAMRNLRELGLDELIARARWRRACRCWASASGMQLLFERSVELGGARGPRACCAGEVERLLDAAG